MSSGRDHFPRTPRTIVFESLEEGRERELAGELMRIYSVPLEIYYSATSFRRLGEPGDIVAGFFSSRFSQPSWLSDWKARHEIDRIPLRRWLLNSLNFYLHEEQRRLQRDRRAQQFAPDDPPALASSDSAERRFERELSRAIVGEALDRVRDECRVSGQSVHFEVFMRHFIDQEPYDTLGPAYGLAPTQCAGCARTVATKLRRAMAEILVRDGADPHDLDREMNRLMEALGS